MKNFGISQVGVLKYDKGTQKKGIQIQDYKGPQYSEMVESLKRSDPESYNRLQIEIAKNKSPNSEIVYYTDAQGTPQKNITGAGAMSGTDPIGKDIMLGVALGKPLQWLGNKLFSKGLGKVKGLYAEKAQTVQDFSETMPGVDNLKAMLKAPNFKPAPEVADLKIGDINGYYLGDIRFGNMGKQYGEEIIRRLQDLGYDPSQFTSIFRANNRVVGTPQHLIREQVQKPIHVYASKVPTTINGSYSPSTGKAYLRVSSKPTSAHSSTAHHEGIMHGTDEIVEQFTEGKVPAMYQELVNQMRDTGLFKTEGSEKWYELRATLGQAIRNAYINGAKQRNIKLKDFQFETIRPAFNKSVDMLDVDDLSDWLKPINAYGEDYANILKQYPQLLDKFKHLLKYAPATTGATVIVNE